MKHICTNFNDESTRMSRCVHHPKWMVLRATWVSPGWNLGNWAAFAPHTFYEPEHYATTQQEAFDYARKRALR